MSFIEAHWDDYNPEYTYDRVLHVTVGRLVFSVGWAEYISPWSWKDRVRCWTQGHDRQINNATDPSRRYWCPKCGKVWPA